MSSDQTGETHTDDANAPRFPTRTLVLLIIAAIAVTGDALQLMGRPLICTCGEVKLWHGQVNSSGTSQHISDWYTFSHIIHGFVFYLLTWLVFPRARLATRLLLATLVECGWEILENSNFIIDRYRTATIALDYRGDSILNSMSDIVSMIGGFLLAWRLPVWIIVALAIGMELTTGYLIRDNLTLNIIMLLHPIDAIRVWQTGAPIQ
jgi:hypothetical protein